MSGTPFDPNNLFGGNGSSGSRTPPRTPGQSASGISVPLDVWEMLNDIATHYGVPVGYLTAAIYYTRDGGLTSTVRNPLTAAEIADVASQMSDAFNATGNDSGSWDGPLTDLLGPDIFGLISTMMPQPDNPQFTVTAPRAANLTGAGGGGAPTLSGFRSIVDIQTAYDLFNAYYGRPPENDQEAIDSGLVGMEYGLAIQKIEGTAEAKTYREEGSAIAAVKSWAQALFRQYLNRDPSPAELKDLVDRGYTEDTLKSKLRAQQAPGSPVGTTVGALADARQLANKWAQSIDGRDATEGEINFMLTNHVPVNDTNIAAFYQQIHDHAVWKVPTGQTVEDWLAAQKRAQQIWQQYGLPGQVPADQVNDMVAGKMTDDQFVASIKAKPAAGYPVGVTIGEIERLKTIAAAAKKILFPGEDVTEAELRSLIGKSPEEIRMYYRSIVPKDSKTGLPIGLEQDVRTIAQQTLQSLGVIGREPTDTELRFFVSSKMTADQIAAHYANLPEIVAIQPGAPFGMTKDQYNEAVARYGDAAVAVFGAGASPLEKPGDLAGMTKDKRDSSLIGSALNDRVSPEQLGSELETFRQSRGRAPTGQELRAQRGQPKQKFAQTEAIPAYATDAAGQQVSPGLGGSPRGAPRPA